MSRKLFDLLVSMVVVAAVAIGTLQLLKLCSVAPGAAAQGVIAEQPDDEDRFVPPEPEPEFEIIDLQQD